MEAKIKFEFTATLWQHIGQGGWHFVSLPKTLAKEIRAHLQWQEEGWGRMKTLATINHLEWETAIWFDTKLDTYLLPIKANIRKKANLVMGDEINVRLYL